MNKINPIIEKKEIIKNHNILIEVSVLLAFLPLQ